MDAREEGGGASAWWILEAFSICEGDEFRIRRRATNSDLLQLRLLQPSVSFNFTAGFVNDRATSVLQEHVCGNGRCTEFSDSQMPGMPGERHAVRKRSFSNSKFSGDGAL